MLLTKRYLLEHTTFELVLELGSQPKPVQLSIYPLPLSPVPFSNVASRVTVVSQVLIPIPELSSRRILIVTWSLRDPLR